MERCAGSWEKFSEMFNSTPPGNDGNIGNTPPTCVFSSYQKGDAQFQIDSAYKTIVLIAKVAGNIFQQTSVLQSDKFITKGLLVFDIYMHRMWMLIMDPRRCKSNS